MSRIVYHRSPDEPEGGWMGPQGPGQWEDLRELDARQRGITTFKGRNPDGSWKT